jgi:hypothetical protein
MSGKTIFDGASPKTQSIDAVKALLSWRGRGTDPMPATVEFTHEGGEGRLMLILSNDKKNYYVTTARACSCPSATYHPGQPCKHMRKHFGAKIAATEEVGSIRPTGKWAGGMNGPVDEIPEVA